MAIDLMLDDDQLLLQRAAGDFFRRRYPSEEIRAIEDGDVGYSPDGWQEMAALGWLGISFPERYGGGGGSFLDLYPLYEEMGRFLVPSPHLDTVAIAGDAPPRRRHRRAARVPAAPDRVGRLHHQPRDPRGRRLVRA